MEQHSINPPNSNETNFNQNEDTAKLAGVSLKLRILRIIVPIATLILALILFAFSIAAISKLPEAPQGDTTFAWLPIIWPFFAGWVLIPLTFIYALKKPKLTIRVCLISPLIYFFSVPMTYSGGDGFPLTFAAINYHTFFLAIIYIPTIFLVRQERKNNRYQ